MELHQVPEKIVSFTGREVDQMEDSEDLEYENDPNYYVDEYYNNDPNYDYKSYENDEENSNYDYKSYENNGKNDYTLPVEDYQIESERSTAAKKKRVIGQEDFKWYLDHNQVNFYSHVK